MRIRPGDPWGGLADLPHDAPVVHSDDALARVVEIHGDDPGLVVGLAGGDLCRTLGGRGDVARRRGSTTTVVPIDVAITTLAGHDHLFVAHLVARRGRLACDGAVVMNAEWLGPWRLAPRGHPGDGLLDVTSGRLPLRQLLLARARARTGDHLPHPALRTYRSDTVDLHFDAPTRIRLDGVDRGRVRDLSIRLAERQVLVAV